MSPIRYYNLPEDMDVHSRSHHGQLAAENEELQDLCCYLDDDRQRLKQSVHKWKARYYQLSFKHKYRYCEAISRQHSTELKETAKQVRTWVIAHRGNTHTSERTSRPGRLY